MSLVSDKSASKILSRSLQRFSLTKILEKIFYPILLLPHLVICIGRRIHWGNCFERWDSASECFQIALSSFCYFSRLFLRSRTKLPNSIDDWERTTVKRSGGHRINCRLERSPDILQQNLHYLNLKMKTIEKRFYCQTSVRQGEILLWRYREWLRKILRICTQDLVLSVGKILVENAMIIFYLNFQDLLRFLYSRSCLQDSLLGQFFTQISLENFLWHSYQVKYIENVTKIK